ncbi:MAG: type II toxin-antitoxin system Phd/YefM family antitoxin [bacterium]|nr:type II toxin-antitoxin system Phd/YefM family antitoxin [bacterium]
MVYVSANDLKKKGVSLLDDIVSSQDGAIITVRGKSKYVVIDMDAYNRFREYELEVALAESREDLAEGLILARKGLPDLDAELEDMEDIIYKARESDFSRGVEL